MYRDWLVPDYSCRDVGRMAPRHRRKWVPDVAVRVLVVVYQSKLRIAINQ